MPITFHPKAGTVLMCDFDGYVAPEMVKTRPVVIVSGSHLPRRGLFGVVPLSGTEPDPIEAYHYKLPKNPIHEWGGDMWAKCDMVCTVRTERLDRIKLAGRNYVTRAVSQDELEAIRGCLKYVFALVDGV
jgi:uncharacterized protein YifN (PemK superfamily)